MAILRIKLCTSINCEWGGDQPWVTRGDDRHYDETNFCGACGESVCTFEKVDSESEDTEAYTDNYEPGEYCDCTDHDDDATREVEDEIYENEGDIHEGNVDDNQGWGRNYEDEVNANQGWGNNTCEDHWAAPDEGDGDDTGEGDQGWGQNNCADEDDAYGDDNNNTYDYGVQTNRDWNHLNNGHLNSPVTGIPAPNGPGPSTDELLLIDAKRAIIKANRAINEPDLSSMEDLKHAIDEAKAAIDNMKPSKRADDWGSRNSTQGRFWNERGSLAHAIANARNGTAAPFFDILSTPQSPPPPPPWSSPLFARTPTPTPPTPSQTPPRSDHQSWGW